MKLVFYTCGVYIILAVLLLSGCRQEGGQCSFNYIHALSMENDVFDSNSIDDAMGKTILYLAYLKSCIKDSNASNDDLDEARKLYTHALVFYISIQASIDCWSDNGKPVAFYDCIVSQADDVGLCPNFCSLIDNALRTIDNRKYTFEWITDDIQSIADRNLLLLKSVAKCEESESTIQP